MPAVSIEHIEIDARGNAKIIGSRIKVIHLVMGQMANGWDANELHRQYPHLKISEIHAALAYYHDHKAELDEQILRSRIEAEELRKQFPVPELVKRLRQQKSQP